MYVTKYKIILSYVLYYFDLNKYCILYYHTLYILYYTLELYMVLDPTGPRLNYQLCLRKPSMLGFFLGWVVHVMKGPWTSPVDHLVYGLEH